jgi:hypothetical protein
VTYICPSIPFLSFNRLDRQARRFVLEPRYAMFNIALSTPILMNCEDSSVSGSRFRASASPSLAHLVRGAAEKVPHPTDKSRTLWDASQDSGKLFGNNSLSSLDVDPEVIRMFELQHGTTTANIGVGPLGSGSDYTVFLQRIGVRSRAWTAPLAGLTLLLDIGRQQ